MSIGSRLLIVDSIRISIEYPRGIEHLVDNFFQYVGVKFSLQRGKYQQKETYKIVGHICLAYHLSLYPVEYDTDVNICFYYRTSSDVETASYSLVDVPTAFIRVGETGMCVSSPKSRTSENPAHMFIEWSPDVDKHETEKIFLDIVKMGNLSKYARNLFYLNNTQAIEDEEFNRLIEEVSERPPTWQRNSLLTWPILLNRLLTFKRIYLTYSGSPCVFPIFTDEPNVLLWQHSNDLMMPQLMLNETPTFLAMQSSSDCTDSIIFIQQSCQWITEFFNNQPQQIHLRSLIIIKCFGELNLQFLSSIKTLKHLVISQTDIAPKTVVFPDRLTETIKHLVMDHCKLRTAPRALGTLIRSNVVNVTDNGIYFLPACFGNLRELRTLLVDKERITFPPANVLKRTAKDIVKYLKAFQSNNNSVLHNEAKLVVVGQEGVGKSTLVKALHRDFWIVGVDPPSKTDGIDMFTLPLKGTRFLVYDLAGDVEYHNTHPLFLSAHCLHLAVFDMSQFYVGKGMRSAEQLCRLELWLQMISAQHPKSYVIIVGTHADHQRITPEMINAIRIQIIQMIREYQNNHLEYFDKCFLCNKEMLPDELQDAGKDAPQDGVVATDGSIPHVLGYYEVSSITKYPRAPLSVRNKNLDALRTAISSSNFQRTNTECHIPKSWFSFYKQIPNQRSEPMKSLLEMTNVASECEVAPHMIESMLRFFHSQGNLLWYEDIPAMKDVVVTDPKWLSDKLKTLISYNPSDEIVCNGILRTSCLSTVWSDITEEDRYKLLSLFRNVGLCFSVSPDEDLFPCNLPIGWPDREKWPVVQSKDENQTSFLVHFSFLPPTFFSQLIVKVNKNRASFPSSIQPLYYRFHILYVTEEQGQCHVHKDKPRVVSQDPGASSFVHKVHYEVMPHNNSLKVSIRGPSPCCIVPGIQAIIESVQMRFFPGISFQVRLICPICEIKKVDVPATFSVDSTEANRVCSRGWHSIGSIDDILMGKYNPSDFESSEIAQTRRIVGETLEDHFCPKLFVILPINTNCLSLKDRIVYSYMKDGYAVHLLCECPDLWHFVDSPGFRIGKPKQFLEKYGKQLCTVLKVIGKLGAPLRAAASLDPQVKTATAALSVANSIANELQGFLDNVFDRYPHLKPSCTQSDLDQLQVSEGHQRSELAKFLEVVAKGREFGPLVFTYVDKRREWLWLCEDHQKQFAIVKD